MPATSIGVFYEKVKCFFPTFLLIFYKKNTNPVDIFFIIEYSYLSL